ncbi:MAG TPA: hypothetical protein VFI24_09315 [Pyrinomonadaceae bacterium]|nr:hypothetical protein [Pyrinomonadaceae bacterium]
MTISLVDLNSAITTAITAHLLNFDALPPNTHVPELAKEITEVVFATLRKEGITEETLDRLVVAKTAAAASQAK